jgi:antitoxin component YwqK of YwqJK toxin-antitoxin module
MHPVDSLVYTIDGDTTFFNEKFQPDGYVRICRCSFSGYCSSSFHKGKLKNGKRIGKWLFYRYLWEDWNVKEERNYDEFGRERFHGKFIEYAQGDTFPILIYNYWNGVRVGYQYKFHFSGALHTFSELDSTGAYINDYLVLHENGDTLYHENLGSSGTGRIIYYSRWNTLDGEANFVNRKREGWQKEYLSLPEPDTTVLIDRKLYRNDTLISKTFINTIGRKITDLNREVDSCVIYYRDWEPVWEICYYKGKILKDEKLE